MDRHSFECTVCGKTFATQSSLTRHSHNHGNIGKHRCSVCDVCFSRKDLLLRHSRIHERSLNSSEESNGRQRTHTACIECRQARAKCVIKPGEQSCTACLKDSRTCSFSTHTRRISTLTHNRTRTPDHGEPEEMIRLEETLSTQDSSSWPNSDGQFESGLPVPGEDRNLPLLQGSRDPGVCSEASIQWAYLHEDLFFQRNLSHSGDDRNVDKCSASGNSSHMPNVQQVSQQPGPVAKDRSALGYGRGSVTPPRLQTQINHIASQKNIPRDTSDETAEQHSWFPQAEDERPAIQARLAAELVAYAKDAAARAAPGHETATYWASMAHKVHTAFELDSPSSFSILGFHPFACFIDLYFAQLYTLWPLFPLHTFNASEAHPLLFLAITSLGSMLAGARASRYGALIHEQLREYLMKPLFELQTQEEDSLALAQARALTQVATLYFGQKRAFSYSQHLGGVLVSQARRMNLFTPRHQDQLMLLTVPENKADPSVLKDWLHHWIQAETRRRLAYAILRLETYTSVLLNSRSTVAAEEIWLNLPCSKYLWSTSFGSDVDYVSAIRQDAALNMQERMALSDAVNIALEENEVMPQMDVTSHELVLFGLQQHVGRCCQDTLCFQRNSILSLPPDLPFDGISFDSIDSDANGLLQSERRAALCHTAVDPLTSPFMVQRRMEGQRQIRRRTCLALREWRQSFALVSTRASSPSNRTCLLSSLLLYHVSFLQLTTPLEDLHHISYHLGSDKSPNSEIVQHISEWTQSNEGHVAAKHACMIWKLLSTETRRRSDDQARYDFLSLIALHHAAVVMWTYVGTHYATDRERESIDKALSLGPAVEAPVGLLPPLRHYTGNLMTLFVDIISQISPAGSMRSSFVTTIVRLASMDFPLRGSVGKGIA